MAEMPPNVTHVTLFVQARNARIQYLALCPLIATDRICQVTYLLCWSVLWLLKIFLAKSTGFFNTTPEYYALY